MGGCIEGKKNLADAFMPELVSSMDDTHPGFAQELIGGLRLKDLLFVQRVAEHRSLSLAAAEFATTQPAASRWLRDLERLFRAHLFTRDRMIGMTPTPLGELVVTRSRELLADVAVLSSDIESHRAGRGGHLQLGVIPYVSTRLLERLVTTLAGEYAMTVSVVEAATEPLMEQLRMQALHAVIVRCPPQAPAAGLRQEVLFTQKACLLVHEDSGLRAGAHTLASLSGIRWVMPPASSPSWHAILAAFRAAKTPAPHPVVETASTKLAHALVAGHPDMAAVLPLDIGSDLGKLGGVRVLPFPAPFRMPPVGLIAQGRRWNLSHIAALRKTLRTLVATGQVLDTL